MPLAGALRFGIKNVLQTTKRCFNKATNYQALARAHDMPPTEVTTLDNGFRIASEDWGSPTSTVGIWVDAGSRYENDKNNGVAHFLEHMAFKGTGKRTQHGLELEVENKGAHLNAYTSREMTVYYAKCFSNDAEWAVELLADIIKNSKYDSEHIERERGVILREMEEIESNFQEVVFDYLHATAYQGTPLGRTILGPAENVKSMKREDLVDFVANFYKPPKMVLSSAGGIDHKKLTELAQKYFGDMKNSYEHGIPVREPCRYTGSDIRHRDDAVPLAHVAFAVEGPGWSDTDTIPLMIASSVHGSWELTHGGGSNVGSDLAVQCFKTGYCHSFQSFFTCYHDTSLWGMYLTSIGSELQRVSEYFLNEWARMTTSISEAEVERAKNQLLTGMLLQLDGTTPTCEEIGRHMLTYDRRIPFAEIMQRINSTTANDVREVLDKYVYARDPVIAGYGPTEALIDYNRARYKLRWNRR